MNLHPCSASECHVTDENTNYQHEAVHVYHPKTQFEHLNHLLEPKRSFPSERKVHKAVYGSSAAARF